jgi:hypothetical protein
VFRIKVISTICALDFGMPLRNSLLVLLLTRLAFASGGSWEQILAIFGVPPSQIGVFVTGPLSPADASWRTRVESGAFLILEGESPLAASFGFRASPSLATLNCLIDRSSPELPLILEKPLVVHVVSVPSDAKVFSKDRWSPTPAMAGFRLGKGAVLWVAASPGRLGYERFPYIPQALVSLGFQPPVSSRRTWAFFDYSYRTRADLDYLAKKWRTSGLSALHVSAWHFYDRFPDRDAYLSRLIEACHREGILVYAWLELPHVSDKFWDDHPEWSEKTAVLQDAQLDWRKLMNLANPQCARAVKRGISSLLGSFDWDGVNLAELYFESLEGVSNPSRFTPLNDDVRSEFRAENGFDPADLWTSRRSGSKEDLRALRLFLDFRIGLVRKMQSEWLGEMERVRAVKPDVDIVLTHVDDRMDASMSDAIGADSSHAFSLLKDHVFTFMVEDPATLWSLGPLRYPEIAKRYPSSSRLAVDINVVERYQDVYPTKQQTGVELFQLIHFASNAFPRVALYFENSILSADLPLIPAASAAVTRFEWSGNKLLVDSPRGFSARWSGPALVDGLRWAAFDDRGVIVPPGSHVIEASSDIASPRLTYFNGQLFSAVPSQRGINFHYFSNSRALASVNCEVISLSVDSRPFEIRAVGSMLILPAGDRHAVFTCK